MDSSWNAERSVVIGLNARIGVRENLIIGTIMEERFEVNKKLAPLNVQLGRKSRNS
jgi:hypothetical protein